VAEIFLKRTLSGFEAADDAAKEAMRKWAPGTQVKANCRVPRALRSLRRYWALVGMVQENTDMFPSRDALHAFLKIRAGHCTPIVIKASGEIVLVPTIAPRELTPGEMLEAAPLPPSAAVVEVGPADPADLHPIDASVTPKSSE
jgi:hypothetical protein